MFGHGGTFMRTRLSAALAAVIILFGVFGFSAVSFGKTADESASELIFDSSDLEYSVSVFAPKSVFRDELVGGTDVEFSVFRKGVKLSHDEVAALDLSVTADDLSFISEVLEDGTVRVRICGLTSSRFLSYFIRWLSVYTLKTGDRTVKLTFYSEKDNVLIGNSATVCIMPEPFGRYVLFTFIPFILLAVALGYVFKSRFTRNYLLLSFDVTESDGRLEFKPNEKRRLGKVGFRSFIPYVRNKTRIGGIKVAACGVFRKRFYIRSAPNLLSFAKFALSDIRSGDIMLPEARKKGRRSHVIFSAGEAVLLKTRDGFVCVAAQKKKRKAHTAEKYDVREPAEQLKNVPDPNGATVSRSPRSDGREGDAE